MALAVYSSQCTVLCLELMILCCKFHTASGKLILTRMKRRWGLHVLVHIMGERRNINLICLCRNYHCTWYDHKHLLVLIWWYTTSRYGHWLPRRKITRDPFFSENHSWPFVACCVGNLCFPGFDFLKLKIFQSHVGKFVDFQSSDNKQW